MDLIPRKGTITIKNFQIEFSNSSVIGIFE